MSAADLEKARLTQLEALESLRDWWNDWGVTRVTLRPRYGMREQLELGLTLGKKRGGPGEAQGARGGDAGAEVWGGSGGAEPRALPRAKAVELSALVVVGS